MGQAVEEKDLLNSTVKGGHAWPQAARHDGAAKEDVTSLTQREGAQPGRVDEVTMLEDVVRGKVLAIRRRHRSSSCLPCQGC